MNKDEVIEQILKLRKHYENVRQNTYCRKTENDDCDTCRADHYLKARLEAIDECLVTVRMLKE